MAKKPLKWPLLKMSQFEAIFGHTLDNSPSWQHFAIFWSMEVDCLQKRADFIENQGTKSRFRKKNNNLNL